MLDFLFSALLPHTTLYKELFRFLASPVIYFTNSACIITNFFHSVNEPVASFCIPSLQGAQP